MTQPTVSSDATEEVTQVASMPEAVRPVTSVAEPKILGAVKELENAHEAVVKAEDSGTATAKQLKDLQDQLAKLTSEFSSQKDKFAAANNEKIAFAANNSNGNSPYSRKDVAIALVMAAGKTNSAPSIESFKATKFGRNILSTKATITTVDALITDFTAELNEQMQIELKVAKLLRSMQITAQHFKVPVADEDTNGDIAMFANGTYNVGETDSTRVPTTRQNTITAVDLTPHKFMGTTHIAKDEEEDVLIPLLGFQINSLMRRMARTVDKSLLRGDGSLTGFTASPTNPITVGVGYQSVITGIATLAAAQSGLKVPTGGNSTKATPTSIASARAVLGRYGLDVASGNLVYLTSIEGYNELVTTSDFRTMDKFGPNATYLTGQVGAIYGIPVVVTEFLDVVGVAGNHVGLLVYLPGFLIGERRAFEVETWYDPRRQLTAVYLSTRFDMKALTTNANAALDTTKYSMASVVTAGT